MWELTRRKTLTLLIKSGMQDICENLIKGRIKFVEGEKPNGSPVRIHGAPRSVDYRILKGRDSLKGAFNVSVYIYGSLAFDRIMDFPGRFTDHILPEKIHVLNVCFNVNGLKEHFGGTAGNIAFALASLGERPVIMATAGKDFGPYREWLDRKNISCEHVEIVNQEHTASAYITTDKADNQITGFNPGAMKHTTSFEPSGEQAQDSLAIIAAGNLDDMKRYARVFRERGIPYILDPGQSLNIWDSKSLVEAITGSSVFISNDYELDLTLKHTGLTSEELMDRTGMIVTTKGEEGSVIATKEKRYVIPAVPAKRVVDPTGAGDAYRAGLIKGLREKRDLETCGRMGSAISSFAVEAYGTQEYLCDIESFALRYKQFFGTEL